VPKSRGCNGSADARASTSEIVTGSSGSTTDGCAVVVRSIPLAIAKLGASAMPRKVGKAPFDPKVFLATVDGGRTISKYRTHQKVFSQGDPADAVFYIQKGQVKLTVVSEHGKEAIVAVLGADEFCGEGCLTGQPRHMATAAAMTECEIMRLEKSAIIRVLHEEPAFSEMFISHLLVRTIRVEADLVDQLFNSSEKRLARALLLLANFGKEGRPEPIIAKVSQETLAEMIGTTRARVSHFMNKFRKLGLIDYNGHLEIHSSLLNVVLHDEPHISDDDSGGSPDAKVA
jgi:CRP/FNR family transcriptional regulator, cyclic AMP receptor protein